MRVDYGIPGAAYDPLIDSYLHVLQLRIHEILIKSIVGIEYL
jgi:hypothetical protein